ncbi:MAG: hypothetical protein KBT12_05070 [Bacteroidales bacterium]|nr:hypothetical protein [Candidatus Physcousia equi]
MRRDRLQNYISGSVFTLPLCTLCCVALWWLSSDDDDWWERGGGLLLVAATTYVLVELNNRNILLRIRTRLVSSTWLLSAAAIPLVHRWTPQLTSAFSLAASYYLLFCTFQKHRCQTTTFHWALMVGIGSIFVPQMIVCLPLFLCYQTTFLRSMSWRTFCAAIVGCLLPLSLWSVWWLSHNDHATLLNWVNQITALHLIDSDLYPLLTLQQGCSWLLLSLLGLLGMLHYLSTSYDDRIQVRMMFYILCSQFVVIELYVGLQPDHLDTMLPMLMVTASPLIAHFFALTSSWFTNALFVLTVLAFGALAYLNIWMPSSTFLHSMAM